MYVAMTVIKSVTFLAFFRSFSAVLERALFSERGQTADIKVLRAKYLVLSIKRDDVGIAHAISVILNIVSCICNPQLPI